MKIAKKLLEKLKHNFLLKLLSVFIAFVMWMVVINTEDPVIQVTIRDVAVSMMNQQVIVDSGKIPEVLSGETVDVVVQARKSICDKLTREDIIAVADFEKLSITNTVPIEVSVKNYNDNEADIIRGQNQFVKLSLDDFETKEFRVKVVVTGEPREGYVVASNVASPNVITVSGSKTQLSKIKDVIVTVNAAGRFDEFSSSVRPVAIDGNGDTVPDDKITISTEAITVNTLIYATKELTVEVEVTGETHEDYEITGISVQPAKVLVAGLREELKLLPTVITKQIDVEGATSAVEANLYILDLIDKELMSIIAVDDGTVAVKIDVERQQTETKAFMPSYISFKGGNDSIVAELIDIDQRVIRVQGRKDVLSDITSVSLGACIDISEYTEEGVYSQVPVVFESISGIKVLTEVKAEIKITDKTVKQAEKANK